MSCHVMSCYVLLCSDMFCYVLIPSGKLTWQWKMDQLKMYSLLMGIFHGYVSLPEGMFCCIMSCVYSSVI